MKFYLLILFRNIIEENMNIYKINLKYTINNKLHNIFIENF